MKKVPALRTPLIVRFFTSCAVLSCLMQWMWSLLLLVYPFLHSDIGKLFLPSPHQPIPPSPSWHAPTPIAIIITVLSIIASLVLCIVAIVWAPSQVIRTTQRTSQKAAAELVPIVTHHQKLTPKQSRLVAGRVLWYLEFIAVVLPFILLFLTPFISSAIEPSVSIAFGGILFVLTLFFIILGWIARRLLRVKQ